LIDLKNFGSTFGIGGQLLPLPALATRLVSVLFSTAVIAKQLMIPLKYIPKLIKIRISLKIFDLSCTLKDFYWSGSVLMEKLMVEFATATYTLAGKLY